MNKPSISKKISPEVKESALLVGTGVIYQQLGNYTQAQENIDAGVTKIRGIYMENQRDTGIFNIYELFRDFLENCQKESDIDVNSGKLQNLLEPNNNNNIKNDSKNNLLDIIKVYSENARATLQHNKESINKLLQFTFKVFSFLSKINEGFYLSTRIFLRKEIFNQDAPKKLKFKEQRFDLYKQLTVRLENLSTQAKSKTLSPSNLETLVKFINNQQSIINQLIRESETGTAHIFQKIGNTLIPGSSSQNITSQKFFTQLGKLSGNIKLLEDILNPNNYMTKQTPSDDFLATKTYEICKFLYNTIIKWTVVDINVFTVRFLQKKILSFEDYSPVL